MNIQNWLDNVEKFSRKILGKILLGAAAILLIAGLTNYTGIKFQENRDLTPIYYLITFSFTIAGFTLLGSVFSKKKPQKMEIKMLTSCRSFLSAGLLFLLFIAVEFNQGVFKGEYPRYIFEKIVYPFNPFIFFIGMLFFCLGLLGLIIDIDQYLKKIDPRNN